jgi:hypothetical protein
LSGNQTVKEDSPDASYSKSARDLMEHRFVLATPICRVSKSQENFRESPINRAFETLENIRKGSEKSPGISMAGYM